MRPNEERESPLATPGDASQPEILLVGRFWRWTPADYRTCLGLRQKGYRLSALVLTEPDWPREWAREVQGLLVSTGLFQDVRIVEDESELGRPVGERPLYAFDRPLGDSDSAVPGVEELLFDTRDFGPRAREISSLADGLTEARHGDRDIDWKPHSLLEEVLDQLHGTHFELWHREDEARRRDVPDRTVAETKHRIDELNQRRNDLMERMDEVFLQLLQQYGISGLGPIGAESIGSLCDRLIIWSLKIYHMREQAERRDVTEDHRERARSRLEVLRSQRKHLEDAYDALRQDLLLGRRRLTVYRQFKLYNDPSTNPALYARGRQR
ncbi:MAG: DUF4254 domain-containing protein [candidate division KSB1 bacterium]|nr:DUF4254 domain-containing protein [candidate division KSB1 bacterium]